MLSNIPMWEIFLWGAKKNHKIIIPPLEPMLYASQTTKQSFKKKKKTTEVKYKTPRFAPDYLNQSLCLSSSHSDTHTDKQTKGSRKMKRKREE